MNKVSKFSKSYVNIFKIKKDFYDGNEINLKNAIKINNLYKKQPLRKCCKNCGSKKNLLFTVRVYLPKMTSKKAQKLFSI